MKSVGTDVNGLDAAERGNATGGVGGICAYTLLPCFDSYLR
jgi:hypothetical protein